MIEYKDLNANYLCLMFPEITDIINIENSELGCNLPHSLFGNVLNPITKNLLKSNDYYNDLLVLKIFEFYESLAKFGDENVKNLLQVTLLEYLWDDYVTYSRSLTMMGQNTKYINNEIGKYLSIPFHN